MIHGEVRLTEFFPAVMTQSRSDLLFPPLRRTKLLRFGPFALNVSFICHHCLAFYHSRPMCGNSLIERIELEPLAVYP